MNNSNYRFRFNNIEYNNSYIIHICLENIRDILRKNPCQSIELREKNPIGCFARVFLALISSVCVHPMDHSVLVLPAKIL